MMMKKMNMLSSGRSTFFAKEVFVVRFIAYASCPFIKPLLMSFSMMTAMMMIAP
jgi:hypothetical protein